MTREAPRHNYKSAENAVTDNDFNHTPVLLEAVIDSLSPESGKVYVDGTLGAGGYTKALLDSANCIVVGIDRDPYAISYNKLLSKGYPDRLHLICGHFGNMNAHLSDCGLSEVDGVALDLGVSSLQIDNPDRGFSFGQDGPLDMRMSQSGKTASELVNSLDQDDLADIIYKFGEERLSRRIARAIVAARENEPIETTTRLAEIIRSVKRNQNRSKKNKRNKIDPATRTFQALRIEINDELNELQLGLNEAEKVIKPGGRLAVVSFHSLEDRNVKIFLRQRSGNDQRGSRHRPDSTEYREPTWRLLKKRAIKPTEAEISSNPRARSARLRIAERTAAPSWSSLSQEGQQ